MRKFEILPIFLPARNLDRIKSLKINEVLLHRREGSRYRWGCVHAVRDIYQQGEHGQPGRWVDTEVVLDNELQRDESGKKTLRTQTIIRDSQVKAGVYTVKSPNPLVEILHRRTYSGYPIFPDVIRYGNRILFPRRRKG